jgi:DNA-binding transcriptional MerR regulator
MTNLSPTSELITISAAAETTGLTPAILRVWQQRYKWPIPVQAANGYRKFTQQHVQGLLVVAHYLKLGRSISSILGDPRISPLHNPEITLDILYPPRGRRVEQQFTEVPRPVTEDAQRLRQQLVAAINAKDLGRIAKIEAEATRLSPSERHLAVTAVLDAAHKQSKSAGVS